MQLAFPRNECQQCFHWIKPPVGNQLICRVSLARVNGTECLGFVHRNTTCVVCKKAIVPVYYCSPSCGEWLPVCDEVCAKQRATAERTIVAVLE